MTEIETKEREQFLREMINMPLRLIESQIAKQLAATLSSDVERELSKMLIHPDRMGAASAIDATSLDLPIVAEDVGVSLRVPRWSPAGPWPPEFHPRAFVVTTQIWHDPHAAPVLPVAHAVPAPAAIDAELLEHEALARKLGVACVAPEIGRARLAEALIAEGITCYDMDAVQKYMSSMAQSKGMSWSWYPARAVDVSSSSDDVYEEPIPLPVLMTMGALVERLGDQVQFKIAALSKPKLDPFLAVHAMRDHGPKDWFVIERWDEPSFRGVKA